MQTTYSIEDWTAHLRHLVPITGIVHVGGTGREAARYAEWAIPSVVFIEADEKHAEKLQKATHGRPGWVWQSALLSDSEGERDFFVASNPNESGLLQPEKLSIFWRNLKTKETRSLQTVALDTLLEATDEEERIINCAVVDCLPALPVLQGAAQNIKGWDVIIARVVLNELQFQIQGTGKSELDSYLAALGFHCIALEEEKQPALGRALYVRNWKALHCSSQKEQRKNVEKMTAALDDRAKQLETMQQQNIQLSKVKDEQVKLSAERQNQILQLTQARDEQIKLATDRAGLLKKIEQEKDALAKQVEILQQRNSQLSQAKDEQAKLAADRHNLIQQLTKARDEQTKLATERADLLKKIEQEKDALVKQTETLQQQTRQLSQAKDEQVKLAAERQAEIARLKASLQEADTGKHQLESKLADYEHRQQLMHEEMVRAEGQIDLIKDVLLREPGL